MPRLLSAMGGSNLSFFTFGFRFWTRLSTGGTVKYYYVLVCTLNHVAVDNPRFQKQGYGRMLQSERGEGVECGGIASKFKK